MILPIVLKGLPMSPAQKPLDESTYSGRFAARLRMLREKTGMNGQEMADAITQSGFDTPMRTHYGWKSGRRDAPLNAFPAIAAALVASECRFNNFIASRMNALGLAKGLRDAMSNS